MSWNLRSKSKSPPHLTTRQAALSPLSSLEDVTASLLLSETKRNFENIIHPELPKLENHSWRDLDGLFNQPLESQQSSSSTPGNVKASQSIPFPISDDPKPNIFHWLETSSSIPGQWKTRSNSSDSFNSTLRYDSIQPQAVNLPVESHIPQKTPLTSLPYHQTRLVESEMNFRDANPYRQQHPLSSLSSLSSRLNSHELTPDNHQGVPSSFNPFYSASGAKINGYPSQPDFKSDPIDPEQTTSVNSHTSSQSEPQTEEFLEMLLKCLITIHDMIQPSLDKNREMLDDSQKLSKMVNTGIKDLMIRTQNIHTCLSQRNNQSRDIISKQQLLSKAQEKLTQKQNSLDQQQTELRKQQNELRDQQIWLAEQHIEKEVEVEALLNQQFATFQQDVRNVSQGLKSQRDQIRDLKESGVTASEAITRFGEIIGVMRNRKFC
ncbi:hypothetical protein OCU04_007599 [Sclerotinia nivalis]|uniref:Uncharacterized protein n=1 Tax=Sclerotinia nivalis TaxID=352851 RepID=A0A9X0DHH4_9HELO|nr:hypothetical protein OCU04_007599 [Sclerotinia nivalis]